MSRPQNETRVALELFSFAVQRHVLGVGALFDNYRNFVVFYQPEAEDFPRYRAPTDCQWSPTLYRWGSSAERADEMLTYRLITCVLSTSVVSAYSGFARASDR